MRAVSPTWRPRPRSLVGLVVGLILMAPASRETIRGAEAAATSPAAAAIMDRIETDLRRRSRVVRLEAVTRGWGKETVEETLWGVVSGSRETTRTLYAFLFPEEWRGMALLIEDTRDEQAFAESWIYLPSFKKVNRVQASARRLLIPKIGLSYEDARGFLAGDTYAFAPAAGAPEGPDAPLTLIARPRTLAARQYAGYGELTVQVDRGKRLMTRVEYRGPHGRPVKTYAVEETVRLGDLWLPKRVRIAHEGFGFTSEIAYTYWPLRTRPPEGLFEPSLAEEPFLPRLLRVLKAEEIDAGLGGP